MAQDAEVDDAAETTERASLSPGQARRIVRRRPSRADTTDELEVQDILLEAYLDEPVPSRAAPPACDAAVDALLSDAFGVGERPSLGPMLVSTSPPPLWPSTSPSAFAPPVAPTSAATGGFALVGLGLVLVAAGALLGAGAVLRFRGAEQASGAPATVAIAAPDRVVGAARAIAARAPAARPAPAAPAPVLVPVTALPPAAVPPDRARLLLPASARGHRIFFDGAQVGEGAAEVLVRCGKKHVLRIGSAGAPRELDPPCGTELDLR